MINLVRASMSKRAVLYFILAFGGILMMFPFARMALMSLMTVKEIQSFPPVWIPERILFSNYTEALLNHNLLRSLLGASRSRGSRRMLR